MIILLHKQSLKGGGEVGTVRKLRDAQRVSHLYAQIHNYLSHPNNSSFPLLSLFYNCQRRRLQSRSGSGGAKCNNNKACNNGDCKGLQIVGGAVVKQGQCDCDDGWTGRTCNTEIVYETTLVVLSPTTQQRGTLRCANDMASFVDNFDGPYDPVVPVEVDWCGGRFRAPTFRMGGGRQLKSSSTEVREIVVGAVVSRRDVTNPDCLAELENAALDLDDMKWKDQDRLWRSGDPILVDVGPCDGRAVVLAVESDVSRKSRSRQLQ